MNKHIYLPHSFCLLPLKLLTYIKAKKERKLTVLGSCADHVSERSRYMNLSEKKHHSHKPLYYMYNCICDQFMYPQLFCIYVKARI